MITVTFATAFRRHVDCPDETLDLGPQPAALQTVLDAYFARHPAVRTYVLDDTGAVRRHVTVFVGNDQVAHRDALRQPVAGGTTVHLFQALSGG
jgi:molybdopterin converting factor small subunit